MPHIVTLISGIVLVVCSLLSIQLELQMQRDREDFEQRYKD